MAKKIANPDEELNVTENGIPGGDSNETNSEQEEKRVEPQTEIPSNIDGILKVFSSYRTLFVDAQGGIFTPDTPETIRGKAVLYKNPHYKS